MALAWALAWALAVRMTTLHSIPRPNEAALADSLQG
jgi:hypothetical protein